MNYYITVYEDTHLQHALVSPNSVSQLSLGELLKLRFITSSEIQLIPPLYMASFLIVTYQYTHT